MVSILEMIMLICFGFSWPINFRKAYQSRSTKGVSLTFFCLIEAGYISGIDPEGWRSCRRLGPVCSKAPV